MLVKNYRTYCDYFDLESNKLEAIGIASNPMKTREDHLTLEFFDTNDVVSISPFEYLIISKNISTIKIEGYLLSE
jgi:hypothetical protein